MIIRKNVLSTIGVAFFHLPNKKELSCFSGCCFGRGFLLVANDIAPAYAGIVFGISNTLATIPNIVSPYTVAPFTEKVRLVSLKYL